MQTYCLEMRHAPSKRKLNALADNRLPPLRKRLEADILAIAWAQAELLEFAKRRKGPNFAYVEAQVTELLAFGELHDGKDYRRLGRWVANADGLTWRESPFASMAEA